MTESKIPSCVITDTFFRETLHHDIPYFSEVEIEEWKHKWTPKKIRRRKYGYVTYKLISESRSFPDSSIEQNALTIALRQWG